MRLCGLFGATLRTGDNSDCDEYSYRGDRIGADQWVAHTTRYLED